MASDSDDRLEGRPQANSGTTPPRADDEPLGPAAFMLSVPLMAGPPEASAINPEMEALRARLAEQRAAGQWEPWFVELPDSREDYVRSLGLPAPLRAIPAQNLKKLYPPNVCRRMLRHRRDHQVIEGLFNRWLPFVTPLIRVGVLLDDVGRWPGGKLIDDLRSAEGFASALTELEVWASLAKTGYQIDREPLGPDGSRPDFGVYVGGVRSIIEVKTLLRSDGERMAEQLRFRMSVAAGPLIREGQVARVSATAKVRELLDTVAGRQQIQGSDGDAALAMLREESDRLAALNAPVGLYLVGDSFAIKIEVDAGKPLGSVACGVWDGQDEERRAVRLASVVEAALEQIPPAALGVVVVDIGEPLDVRVAADVLSRRTAERPVLFSPLAFVVLRWKAVVAMRSLPTGAILPHRRTLTNAEARLASALLR